MDNTWVKLYRKISEHEVLYDDKALRVFIWLLTNVNKNTGTVIVSRHRTSSHLRLNPSTFYRVLKRLEKKYKIVTAKVTTEYTTISLANWSKYQSTSIESNRVGNNKVTTNEQQSNTITRIKNKEYKNITNVIGKMPEFGNKDINLISSYFLEVMAIPKEDCSAAQSRRFWYLLLRESKTGVAGVKWLVDLAKNDQLLGPNITSSKDLYYKRMKLVTRKRGTTPKVAVMDYSEPVGSPSREGGVISSEKELEANDRDFKLLLN